jgi:DnaK suppressor protein
MMTKADLERFESTLQALKDRLRGDVSRLAGEALRTRDPDSSGLATPSDPGDQGSDSYVQEFALSLLHNQEQTLEQIDEALERIKQGKFGRCEECGTVIPKARLQAVPYTRYCVSCARKLQ